MDKIKVAIIGPGNIGSDLMYKIMRSKYMEMALMVGIKESEGTKRAEGLGIPVTINGIQDLLGHKDIKIVFEATSAAAHAANAPLLHEAGMFAIDLTPAAVGPYMVPVVNLDKLLQMDTDNINLVTCGGQATIPLVYAVTRVAGGEYGEIVSCISSKSAGVGTRANIDEFTETTAKAIEVVGGADRGKAIIILNPAEPPLMMTNTVYVKIKDKNCEFKKIEDSVLDIVSQVQKYVPGYKLKVPPILDGDKVTVSVEVEGQGDFLPKYSGNLDIINAAAVQAGDRIAARMLGKGE
ncbi:MAG: acetaldehyde dehydrogenase (acetylating) [Erysipelotrichaceae bacterium]|jgi:acetaldehyde dehydrogenase|nr:acetaldehyde dehydrogenase (acetylating) [Erysipelotrichaceae bacterium]